MILSDGFRKPSGKELAEFERRLGWEFPKEYRDFLIEVGGGVPCPNTLDIANLDGSPTDIQAFFGIHAPDQSLSLVWNLDILKSDNGRTDSIAIAIDAGGGFLYLDREPRNGIFFIDRNDDPERRYAVAAGFNELLLKLREF